MKSTQSLIDYSFNIDLRNAPWRRTTQCPAATTEI